MNSSILLIESSSASIQRINEKINVNTILYTVQFISELDTSKNKTKYTMGGLIAKKQSLSDNREMKKS